MSVVNFRVSRALKRRMDRLRHLNWSGLLRGFVARTVEEEERRLAAQCDWLRIRAACDDMDRLSELSPEGWHGADVVLQWRRLRR